MSTTTPVAAPAPSRMTVDEFVARHCGDYVELVRGIVKELPVAGLEHGVICVKVAILLGMYVESKDLGRVASNDSFVRTGEDTVRGADVLFYSYERLPKDQRVPAGMHSVAPELVVEVRSPTDRWKPVLEKLNEYLEAGVRAVVLVDPQATTVTVYRSDEFPQTFDNGDTLTLPDVLPGFSVPVSRLFA